MSASLALPSLPPRFLESLAVLVLGHLLATPFLCICHRITSSRHLVWITRRPGHSPLFPRKMKRWNVGCGDNACTIQTDLFVIGQHSVMDITHVRDLSLKARLGKVSRYCSAHLFLEACLLVTITPQQANYHSISPLHSAVSKRRSNHDVCHAFPSAGPSIDAAFSVVSTVAYARDAWLCAALFAAAHS